MTKSYLITVCILLAALFIGFSTPAEAAVTRLEVLESSQVLPPPQPVGWWSRLVLFLQGRSVPASRPDVGTTFIVQASAYSSSPYQTDSTPCITAAGTRVRTGVAASNFLPLGTLLDINGKPFIVEDRMNRRYKGYYLDVWFPSTEEALQFGRRKLTITITGYGTPGQALSRAVAVPVVTSVEPTPRVTTSPTPLPTIEVPLWDTVKEQARTVNNWFSDFVPVRVRTNVNQYDVNCLS